ncbi:MAG: hypothetical protein RBU21_00120 [FCB group bacterium]|jgi:hypothetical protein|nr:hypothetical protein [FCB group bacterium]
MKTELFGAGRSSRWGKPLEFEPSLWADVGRVRQPRRAKPFHKRYGTMAFLGLIAAVGMWAWLHGSNDNRAIAHMASTAFQWVRDGQINLQLLSSSEPSSLLGGAKVSAESRPDASSPWTSPAEAPLRQAILARIRADIEAKGGTWTDARAVAFGGVRARVADNAGVGAEALTGNVYFVAGGRVFALELSAERVGDAFIPTDLWQCTALNVSPTDLPAIEKHAQDCFQAFMNEPTGNQDPQILDPVAIFVSI